ncbi:hypothetical protein QJS66_20155 [Kocuria rhizophila]|nr:hypothetical protein QJS66_20155 [Kocuria rhizophila]
MSHTVTDSPGQPAGRSADAASSDGSGCHPPGRGGAQGRHPSGKLVNYVLVVLVFSSAFMMVLVPAGPGLRAARPLALR